MSKISVIFLCFLCISCGSLSNIRDLKDDVGDIGPIYISVEESNFKKNKDGLYFLSRDNSEVILDNVNVFVFSRNSGSRNSSKVGIISKGKLDGEWLYYNSYKEIIKKEYWDNGKLVKSKIDKKVLAKYPEQETYDLSIVPKEFYNTLDQFRREFTIKKKKLYRNNKIVSNMLIQLKDTCSYHIIIVKDGFIVSDWIQIEGEPIPRGVEYSFNEKGDIKGIVGTDKKFENGSGLYQEYYYCIEGQYERKVKSEGEIKNNYKVGPWKYYSKEGTVDSIKTFKKKEYIDVRTLFNLLRSKKVK